MDVFGFHRRTARESVVGKDHSVEYLYRAERCVSLCGASKFSECHPANGGHRYRRLQHHVCTVVPASYQRGGYPFDVHHRAGYVDYWGSNCVANRVRSRWIYPGVWNRGCSHHQSIHFERFDLGHFVPGLRAGQLWSVGHFHFGRADFLQHLCVHQRLFVPAYVDRFLWRRLAREPSRYHLPPIGGDRWNHDYQL